MGWFLFTCFLVWTVSGLHQGVMARKPKMIPERDEIIIQEGETLEIKCEGDEWLQFVPEKMGDVEKPFEKSYDKESCFHSFVLKNTTNENTGWYACAEKGIVVKNTDQTIDHPKDDISWIYVYVNSSKPFADESYFRLLKARVGGTIVIPCRPTSPGLRFGIQEGYGDPVNEIEYIPKVGYILYNVSTTLSGKMYSCSAYLADGTTVEGASYNIHVPVPIPEPIIPVIDTMSTRHVVWGESHILKCRITVPPMGSCEVRWKAPPLVPPERLSQKDHFLRHTEEGESIYVVELAIKNVEKDDGGIYVCYSKCVDEENNAEVPVDIVISDPNNTFIHVDIDSPNGSKSTLITIDEGDTAVWKIDIDTYPENFSWTWFKPDSSEISVVEVTSKYIENNDAKYSHSQDELTHYFRISKVEVRDNGNYTLQINTVANKNDTILQLRVRTKPLVQILNRSLYFKPKKPTTFVCNTIASPRSNITWQYLEYPDFPSKSEYRNGSITSIITKPSKHDLYEVVSSANITINMNGDLICKSCNEVACSTATEPILVSDTGEPFSVDVSPAIVTEGDNINLTCSVSVYNYTDELTWTGYQYDRLVSEGKRMTMRRMKTNFMRQSILQISGIKKSDSGEYLCIAFDEESGNQTKSRKLTVEYESWPKMIKGNMKNSSHTVNLTDDKGYRLECVIYGRPIPIITWLKDGDARFINNTRFSIEKNNTVLRIKHFREDDGGRYSCRAENRLGVVEQYTDIIIEGLATQSIIIWISLVCILIVIIIIVIVYMGIRVHRERALRKELCEAGLTHFVDGAVECLNPDLPVDDQAELLPYDKKWEFPPDMLKIGKQLGSGAFGVVMKAQARGIVTEGEITTVAVKMVRSTAEPSYMKALASELKIMIHLGRHLNVVNLLGACTKNILTKRELHVIVEYCRFGNLHNYLQRHRSSFINQIDPLTQKIDLSIGMDRLIRSESIGSQNKLKYADLSFCRSFSVSSAESNSGSEQLDYRQAAELGDISMSPNGGVLSNNSVQPGWRSNYRGDYKDQNLKPICTQDLLCWAWQVARGMEYLSSRNVLHGDLAARNILLADDNIVKICDFGLAKNMYKDNNYKKKGDGPLPIKWMAIESIRDRIYSTQSDVWSFGIVLWEFFTLAQTPYPGMEAETQYDRLIEGYRMPKPIYATDEIYEDIVKDCWKAKPSSRPTFTDLVEKIGTLLNESVKSYYCDLDTPYTEMNIAKLQNGQNDYLTMMSAPNHDYHNSPDPVSDVYPDVDYLSMSPVNKTGDSEIFSPRSDLSESHFEFPPAANNASANSDTEECVESVPMLKLENPYMVPVDFHQKQTDSVKQGKAQTPGDNNYCNMPNNRRSLIAENDNQSPDIMKISDQNTENTKSLKDPDNDAIIPMIYSGHDNYINIPQRKTDRIKDTTDSFSNPSYVIMSKLENDSQFV